MAYINRTVWIIGASSGIGKALAIDLAKQKANLIISSRNIHELNKVQNECLLHTNNCEIVPVDLSQPSDYKKETKNIIDKFTTIDYLFLVSGVSQRSIISETPIEIDRKIMEINYFGNISISKAVLPYMINQKSGHIIPVSSIVGKFGFPLRSAYSASKHALHGYYETLRAEQSHNNIKVTIVIPGRVVTNISKNALLKDGTNYKKMDDGQANGITSESCSKQIIKAVNSNRKEVLIGGKEIAMVWIRRFLPFLFYRFANKNQPK